MTAAFTLNAVSHHFDGAAALREVSLSAAPGERVALLGPSGAGKSTLLALLDGRLRGWRGEAEVLGVPLSATHAPPREQRTGAGFIFQEFALVDRLTVYQNVMNGRLSRMRIWPSLWGRFGEHDHLKTAAALDDTGLSDLARRRADQLSGGQRQRVAIARCLAQDPRLILADEPVSNLDPAHAERILGLITGAADKRGIGVIFSSHQPDLARRFADRIVGLRAGAVQFDKPSAQVTSDDIAELYHGTVPGAGLRVVS
ncbi:phosphonate ABC transporter ATP-binding protein (plasmid) [Leisingera aquaemixtae]|uniref:Phosphonate ABC transporter ATP-binding protein n=1 Tax=Leisingera aquaemixtae TaxID=1396826 RepID=A0ABY5WR25_9RHOB|nr:phosphonate ABC transporter ATP-binding protein [Leisingera aquaemixtae]UWQ44004.1 phosphonate ABC transporter ATP-binding protein [Leisingera aquaemixtae]